MKWSRPTSLAETNGTTPQKFPEIMHSMIFELEVSVYLMLQYYDREVL